MTYSPLTTILWALWNKSRVTLMASLPVLLLVCGAIHLCEVVGLHSDYVQLSTAVALLTIHIVAMFTVLVIHSDSERLRIAPPLRLFRLPVATWKIVAVLMLYGVLAVGAVSVAATFIIKTILMPDLTWWGPPLISIFATGALLTWAYAQSESAPRAAIISFIISAVLGLFIATREATVAFIAQATPLGAVLAITALFYVLALMGFKISRHGGFAEWPSLAFWERAYTPVQGPLPRRFATAKAAQHWYEWRQFGWQLPVLVVAILIIYLLLVPLVAGAFEEEPNDSYPPPEEITRARNIHWITSIQFVTTGMQVAAVVAAVLVGGYVFLNAGYWTTKSSFLLTRPMSTKAMAMGRLTATLQSTGLALGILMATLGALVVYAKSVGEPLGMVAFLEQGYPAAPAIGVVAFYWGVLFTIMWAAVWSVNVGWAMLVYGIIVLPPLAAAWVIAPPPPSARIQFEGTPAVVLQAFIWIGSAIIAVGLLWVFFQSVNKKIADNRAVILAVVGWVAMAAAFIAFVNMYAPSFRQNVLGERFPHPVDWGLWAALSLLPIAPVFTHPWLLSRSRHQ